MAREFSILVNYTLNGVSVSQSIYKGPHRKHADKAFQTAGALGNHGVLINCTVTFYDGYRIRQDLTKTFGDKSEGAFYPAPEDLARRMQTVLQEKNT